MGVVDDKLSLNANNIPVFYKFRILDISEAYIITVLSGGNSKLEPPDPISNSEVKRFSADDSVGSPHVKVGHCQALKY